MTTKKVTPRTKRVEKLVDRVETAYNDMENLRREIRTHKLMKLLERHACELFPYPYSTDRQYRLVCHRGTGITSLRSVCVYRHFEKAKPVARFLRLFISIDYIDEEDAYHNQPTKQYTHMVDIPEDLLAGRFSQAAFVGWIEDKIKDNSNRTLKEDGEKIRQILSKYPKKKAKEILRDVKI